MRYHISRIAECRHQLIPSRREAFPPPAPYLACVASTIPSLRVFQEPFHAPAPPFILPHPRPCLLNNPPNLHIRIHIRNPTPPLPHLPQQERKKCPPGYIPRMQQTPLMHRPHRPPQHPPARCKPKPRGAGVQPREQQTCVVERVVIPRMALPCCENYLQFFPP